MPKTAPAPLPADVLSCAELHSPKIVERVAATFPDLVSAIEHAARHGYDHITTLKITVGDIETTVRFEAEYDYNRWSSAAAKVRGYVAYPNGHRGSRVVLKKDGTFDYARIATALVGYVEAERLKRERAEIARNRRDANQSFIEQFNAAAQPDLGHVYVRDRDGGPPLEVRIQFRAACTGSAAVALATFLKDWHDIHNIE
jgi:hypothetical protein